jgi:hypothetical protein
VAVNGYHRPMSRVADSLRRDGALAEAALPERERVLRALAVGDSDAQLHAAGSGLTVAEARVALQRQRAAGRWPSRCAAVR